MTGKIILTGAVLFVFAMFILELSVRINRIETKLGLPYCEVNPIKGECMK